MARWVFEYEAGILAPGNQIVQLMRTAAWEVEAHCDVSKTGILVRNYTMLFEGSEEAIQTLKNYARALAAANDWY